MCCLKLYDRWIDVICLNKSYGLYSFVLKMGYISQMENINAFYYYFYDK